MTSRGQSALEFTLISIVSLLLVSAAFIVAEQQFVRVQNANTDRIAENLLEYVQAEVEFAYVAGPGYYRYFRIPPTLGGQNYTFTFANESSAQDEISIVYAGKEYYAFLNRNVTGNLSKGWNFVEGGNPVITTHFNSSINLSISPSIKSVPQKTGSTPPNWALYEALVFIIEDPGLSSGGTLSLSITSSDTNKMYVDNNTVSPHTLSHVTTVRIPSSLPALVRVPFYVGTKKNGNLGTNTITASISMSPSPVTAKATFKTH